MSLYIPEIFTPCRSVLNELCGEAYLTCDGRIVDLNSNLVPGGIYRICYRLRGGKGGFGSMLRTIGAQIEKTTNREAMRDLSGRRIRDVNNEKKLADWVAGAAEREREKETRRQERLERRRAEVADRAHRFVDNKYMEQKEVVANNLDDALNQGLKRASTSTASSGPPSKKGKEKATPAAAWCGLDIDPDMLSSSDDEDTQETTGKDRTLPEVVPEVTAEVVPEVTTEVVSDLKELTTENSEDCSNIKNMEPDGKSESSQPKSSSEKSQNFEKDEKDSPSGVATLSTNTTGAVTRLLWLKPSTTTLFIEDKKDTDYQAINLEDCTSVEELESYGSEHLKLELVKRGLKCGGSLQQRAQRLFSVKGLSPDKIDPSILAKSVRKSS